MRKGSFVVGLMLVISLLSCGVWAEESADTFSPTTAEAFYQTAIDLYTDPNATPSQAEEAMVFFSAISDLQAQSQYILPDVVRLAWKFTSVDFSPIIKSMLIKYSSDDRSDLEVTRLAVQYVVSRLNSRPEREQYFTDMLKLVGTRNKILSSEFATQLGLLAAEKTDRDAAEFYLMQAYNGNVYNKIAFEKLVEISSQPMPTGLYIRHLRLMMGANPYDIEAAFAFSNAAYSVGLYGIAANSFEYCHDLFKELHPKEQIPYVIYRPWATAALNDEKSVTECFRIAQMVRASGRFDLVLEAIAGKAALKIGDNEQAQQIFTAAAEKAQQLLSETNGASGLKPQDMAWFYCFATPDPEKALEWANKANASEPNSTVANALMAYALGMNKQYEVAGAIAANLAGNSQIAALALGQVQFAQDSNTAAETIRSAIAMDMGSLESQAGRKLLQEHGSMYVPSTESSGIARMLRSEFGEQVVNKFATVDKLIAVKLSSNGSEFAYGNVLSTYLVISNKSADPMLIFDDGLFKGNIRVDAVVKGDIKEQLPNLLNVKIRPSKPISPSQAMFIPLRLITGPLRNIMIAHPQAKLEVEFTAYLDPVVEPNGTIRNGFASMAPLKLKVRQDAVNVSSSYLQNRLNALAKGQSGQKLASARLFAGLLLEQKANPSYKNTFIEPMLLKSALIKCLNDDNWQIKVETTLLLSKLPLDYQLQDAVSANLINDFWPVRMTSLWLLGKNAGPGFKKVMDWTARNDGNKYVIDMAMALGAARPTGQTEQQEANEPLQTIQNATEATQH